jgi:hypothetical protein
MLSLPLQFDEKPGWSLLIVKMQTGVRPGKVGLFHFLSTLLEKMS